MKMISISKIRLFAACAVVGLAAALTSTTAFASQVCMNTGNGNGGSIAYYPYLFNNNTFGWSTDKNGSYNCLSLNYTSNSGGVNYDGFGSSWNWNRQYNNSDYSVKSFPSMVYGWQYGYTYSGLGLPTIIYNNKNVPTYESLSYYGNQYEDGLIDNWLLKTPNAAGGTQADEVEIFTTDNWNAYGNASNKLGYISLDGVYYVVTRGSNGWPVYNFFPNQSSNNVTVSANIKDFVNALCYDYGVIQNNLYIGGTQIGVEIYYGNGGVTFNPAAISVN